MSEGRLYSLAEEVAHSLIHGLGALLSIAALTILVVAAEGALAVTAVAIYGSTLVLTYSASSVYHAFPARFRRTKYVLQKLDHCSIFLLIAGTYTPVTLVTPHTALGWTLFGVVWGLAVTGVVVELTPIDRRRIVSMLLYLTMGWLVVLAGWPLLTGMAPLAAWLLFAGGIAYTAGIGFYLYERMPYHHAVWHLFVVAGSVFHFFGVLALVAR